MSITRTILMAGAVVLVAACGGADRGDDTSAIGVDTSVTTKTLQDTTIITTDTTIRTDTTQKIGGTTGAVTPTP